MVFFMGETLDLYRQLRKIKKHCKKNPALEEHMSSYAEKLNEKYGKSYASINLLIMEYDKVKRRYD